MAPKKEPEVFVCMGKNSLRFTFPKIGQDGKPAMVKNPYTGVELPDHEADVFKPAPGKKTDSDMGYVCLYEIKEDTNPEAAKAVRRMAANPAMPDVMTYKEFVKRLNPDRAIAEEKLEKVSAQNEALTNDLAKSNAALAEMEKKLREAEARSGKR